MEIKEDKIRLYEDLNSAVFSYFNVDGGMLYHSHGNNLIRDAKMYLYYILHCDYNFSIGQIAQLTKKTQRNIQICIAKIKYRISMYDDYSNDYNCISCMIREKIAE